MGATEALLSWKTHRMYAVALKLCIILLSLICICCCASSRLWISCLQVRESVECEVHCGTYEVPNERSQERLH